MINKESIELMNKISFSFLYVICILDKLIFQLFDLNEKEVDFLIKKYY